MPGVGVAPGDDEHLVALPDEVLGQAAPGGQVGDVVLVDHRRHDQQRVVVDGLGRRLVLDELVLLGAVHHGPGGDRQVPAHLERAGRHHRGHPRLRGQVGDQRPEAAQHADTAAVGCRLPVSGVEQRAVARRGGGDEVGQHEAQAGVVAPVQFGPVEQRLRRLARRQVGLDGALEQGIARPGGVGEPAVLSARCLCRSSCRDHAELGRERRGLAADQAGAAGQPGGQPEQRPVRPEPPQHAERPVGKQEVQRPGVGDRLVGFLVLGRRGHPVSSVATVTRSPRAGAPRGGGSCRSGPWAARPPARPCAGTCTPRPGPGRTSAVRPAWRSRRA